MHANLTRTWRLTAVLAVAGLMIAACGGGSGASASAGASGGTGGTGGTGGNVNIAVNPWTGSAANAAVISYLLKEKLGYDVTLKDLKEGVDWQGFETGEVDAILEVWGHDADRKTFIDDKKVAQDAGKMGVNGTIGWYVPGWMAKEHPDITDWNNLNKYAELFKTSESGDKGQFLLGDPSYVSNDQAIIDNLKLNYKVVTGGSEAALIESLKQATTQKTPLLAYFYDPQWAWSQEPLKSDPLVKINLPPNGPDCADPATDPKKVACDYPAYELYKAVSTKFAENGGKAYELIKNFNWTNLDQSTMAEYIDNEKMTPEAAAAKWVAENEATWSKWMPAQ